MQSVQTVTGGCAPDALGLTLVHEHLLVGWPGWEADAPLDRATRREHGRRCVDRLAELYDLGVRTLIDPCPIDLGRDVEFMAGVAQQSRVRVVCATGLYKEDMGAPAYFKFRQQGDAMEQYLRDDPTKTSKSRIKRLRGLRRPQNRLRVDNTRVFYDVIDEAVEVLAIVPKSGAATWLERYGEPAETAAEHGDPKS